MAGDRMTEMQLAELAAGGDLDAVGELIFGLYRSYLCGVIKKHDNAASDDEIEECLHEFFHFITTPTVDGNYRLRNLDKGSAPRTYIARALDNHLRDLEEAEKRNPVGNAEYDNLPDRDEDRSGIDMMRRREIEISLLLDTLEDCAALSARDRYILVTYLLGERYSGEGHPLRLSEMLGRQLALSPSTVYNSYSRNLKKLQAIARQRLRERLD